MDLALASTRLYKKSLGSVDTSILNKIKESIEYITNWVKND